MTEPVFPPPFGTWYSRFAAAYAPPTEVGPTADGSTADGSSEVAQPAALPSLPRLMPAA